jgi:hypothetical protein
MGDNKEQKPRIDTDNGNCHKLPYSSYKPVILEKD